MQDVAELRDSLCHVKLVFRTASTVKVVQLTGCTVCTIGPATELTVFVRLNI